MGEFFWRQQEIIGQSDGQKAFGSNAHHKTLKYVPELATVRLDQNKPAKFMGLDVWHASSLAKPHFGITMPEGA